MKSFLSKKIGEFVVHQFMLSEIGANGYIVQRGNEAILIDPTANPEELIKFLAHKKINLDLMLATHGHFDHISAAHQLIENGLVETLHIHPLDFIEVKKARSIMMLVLQKKMETPNFSAIGHVQHDYLKEKMGLLLKHVGGHSNGSTVIYSQDLNFIISGDLILNHALKISKFSKDENEIEFSNFFDWLSKKFKPSTIVFTGHGNISTVQEEIFYNPKCLIYKRGNG